MKFPGWSYVRNRWRRRQERRRLLAQPPREIFEKIYRGNLWGGKESVSGRGSDRDTTRLLVAELPTLLASVEARTLVDVPCGDFFWMKDVALPGVRYVGGDIVEALVARNRERFGDERREFHVVDLTSTPLPSGDVLLCRDCLVHLSYRSIFRFLENLRRSDLRFLLTTTFPARKKNADVADGDWRPLNLERPPFRFPPPLRLLNEGYRDERGLYEDKALGLWRVADLLGRNEDSGHTGGV